MKKQLFAVLILLASVTAFGQNEKYMGAMRSNIAAIDSIHTAEGWQKTSNAFSRIADAEKNQWLPYYYAALGSVMNGLFMISTPNPTVTDPLADKAEQLLAKAEALTAPNSEIFVVKKQIATLRMMGDPQNRWQQYGPAATEALNKAKQLNPENPRVYLLEAQDKYYTPEEFGGSKSEARKLLEISKTKFQNFKPESELHPSWGLNQVNYFMSLTGN